MGAESAVWNTTGGVLYHDIEIPQLTAKPGSPSLESRFFADDGLWREAPMLTGQVSFEPLPDVRNILVTGGEGFVASWLVRHLVTKYPQAYTVVSFDKLDYCSSRHNARMLESRPNFHFVHGDVTNDEDVVDCLKRYRIDTIFHLAAHTHVDLSFGNSKSFTKNNVLGTHVLLESAKDVGTVKRFYHISTDEVYGEVKTGQGDLKEHSLLEPTNPYAATKAAAEMMVTAYAKSFKLPTVIIRLNNIYGPHQYPEKIIPKFTNATMRRMPLFLHGDGKHTRRYLYAGDAADAFDTILHKGRLGEVYNVDSRDEVSNFELATKLLSMFGINDTDSWIQLTRDRPFNDRRYAVDGEKLRKLGWTQRTSFDDGLAATVEWYAKFADWWGPVDNTLLAAFPVVKGGHVVKPEASRMIEKEAITGADDHTAVAGGGPDHNGEAVSNKRKLERMGPEDIAGADEHTAPGVGRDNVNGEAISKKRKVELMLSEDMADV